MKVVRDGIQLCPDCMIAAVNGDFSSLDYHYSEKAEARQAEIVAGLERLGPHLVPDFDVEQGRGYRTFSWHGCDCCDSGRLGGTLYEFVILGEG